MKSIRFLSIIFVFVTLVTLLSGCTSNDNPKSEITTKSESVVNVESLISAIGSVTENSENAIISAESAYKALSDDERNQVGNYNTLLDARKDYDAIPKEVELTDSNIDKYLDLGLRYGQYEVTKAIGINITFVDVFLKIYPVVDASFNNVEIVAEITCPESWTVTSSDPAYDKEKPDKMTLKIRLPADGKYEDTHNIGRGMWGAAPNMDCKLNIISVSGTVKEK